MTPKGPCPRPWGPCPGPQRPVPKTPKALAQDPKGPCPGPQILQISRTSRNSNMCGFSPNTMGKHEFEKNRELRESENSRIFENFVVPSRAKGNCSGPLTCQGPLLMAFEIPSLGILLQPCCHEHAPC
jgi:hypothetical protein